ncbi:hypothetical protein B0H11DRAFT_2234378 [Mycena galericulata]|nr:hypothetical protein B0H11DRAFT_2234378 [Mycena galericulata]
MHEPDNNTEKCQGPSPGDGCGDIFPRKKNSGLCHQCDAIEKAATDEEKTKMKNIPQCSECSKIGKNISDSKCGVCKREDAEKATRERAESAKTTAIQVRPDAHAARMSGGPQAPRVSQPTRNPPREKLVRFINVHVSAFVGGKPYLRLGFVSRAYKESFGYEEMVEDVMKAWAYAWDDLFNASLLRREVLVFFHNGLNCHPNSMSGTLGEFFDLHSQLYNSEVFLKVPSKLKGSVKEPAPVLNFVIDMNAFEERTQSKNRVGTTVKRRRIPGPDEEPQAKRAAHGSTASMVSNYIGIRIPAKSARAATEVKFEFLETNDNMFEWTGPTTFSGRLCNEALQTGKDKKVFELDVNGTLYVAKRAITVGIDPDTFLGNENLLHSNLVALWNTKCVLDAFYVAADGVSILDDIDTNLAVQETFLVEELLSTECPPSVASGVSHELLKEAQDEFESQFDYTPGHQLRVIWLIQRRMSPICERWNLMDATKLPNPRNKFGTTVTALSHFFADSVTSESELLSHFQTSNGLLPNKAFGKIITDVIFQNDVGGIPRRTGDKGTTGVEMVLNAHICNRVCELLKLDNDASDKGQGGDDDDDE